MSNPRKFSEKIAIHQQKQAQQEMEFNDVMRDLKSVVARQGVMRTATMPMGMYRGGSLPNFPSPHQSQDLGSRQVQNHGDVIDPIHPERNYQMDAMNQYRGGSSSNARHGHAHGGLVWRGTTHSRTRAGTSPYHHLGISQQPELGSWRRTVSDPAIQQSLGQMSPRGREGAQSPPKVMIPSQRVTKSPDLISGHIKRVRLTVLRDGSGVDAYFLTAPSLFIADQKMSGRGQERTGHMRMQANTSSLPDFTNLNLGAPPLSPVENPDDRNTPSSPTNQGQFSIPVGTAPRRLPSHNTCGRQMFPRQISTEQDNPVQLYQPDSQGNSAHSNAGGSPGSPVVPPFNTWSPLAKEALFSQQLAGLAASRAREQYLTQQLQGQYSSNEGLPMSYRQNENPYPPPRYEIGQISSEDNIPPNKTIGRQANGVPDILVTSNSAGLARELGLGIASGIHSDNKEEFNEEILSSVRTELDPLNFEDYLMLAGNNPEVADQAVEDQFRQDRINFQ